MIDILSLDEMSDFAARVVACVGEGGVRSQGGVGIGLRGPLGVGKTEFVRKCVLALGGRDEVSSPSFVLENIYEVPTSQYAIKWVSHWDLYRLRGVDVALEDLMERFITPKTVTFVEWPEKIPQVIPALALDLAFEFGNNIEDGKSLGDEPLRRVSALAMREPAFQRLFENHKRSRGSKKR